MPTPISGPIPYCSPAQFLERYDVRTVGQLLSDTDVALSQTDVLQSTILNDLLMEASGWVESAALVANRYSPNDLYALATDPSALPGTGNSARMLAGIVAGITMFFLWDRRPTKYLEMGLPLRSEMAIEMLDRLRKGEAIFGIQEVANAGNPDPKFITPEQINTRNFSSNQARRFFGNRADYNVPGTN